MWKALSVIAALLVAGAAILSYLNWEDVKLERDLLVTSETNLKNAEARFGEVKASQDLIARRNSKMEERRDDALAQQEAKKDELEAKTQEVADTNERIKELEAEIAQVKSQIAEFGNIEQLTALIDQLQTDLFTAKNEIATLETTLASKEAREQQTAENIQDYKNLEYRQRNGQMVSINANINSVFNDWGFAVLDAGARDGVVSRTKLDVKRGGEKIAELIVTNLEINRSVCDIVPGSMEPGQMLRPGDRVSVNEDSLPKPPAEPGAATAGAGNAGAGGLPLPDAGAPMADDPLAEDPGIPAGADDPFSDLSSDPAPTPTPTPEAADPDDPFGDL